MEVAPGEICVIPRGVRFSVALSPPWATGGGAPTPSPTPAHGSTAEPAGAESDGARGYVLEVFQGFFTLPDLGPIGMYACAGGGVSSADLALLIRLSSDPCKHQSFTR